MCDYLGRLIEICEKYNLDPKSEISEIAKQALYNGEITPKVYYILENRVPFPGFTERSRKDVGKYLGVTEERIRQIEAKTYSILKKKTILNKKKVKLLFPI